MYQAFHDIKYIYSRVRFFYQTRLYFSATIQPTSYKHNVDGLSKIVRFGAGASGKGGRPRRRTKVRGGHRQRSGGACTIEPTPRNAYTPYDVPVHQSNAPAYRFCDAGPNSRGAQHTSCDHEHLAHEPVKLTSQTRSSAWKPRSSAEHSFEKNSRSNSDA